MTVLRITHLTFALPLFTLLIGLRFLVQWARNRPLTVTSLETVAGSYKTILVTHKLWVYLLGMAFGLAGLAQMAPTRGDIERRQQQIAAQGSPLSLLEALMAPPPGRRDGRHS